MFLHLWNNKISFIKNFDARNLYQFDLNNNKIKIINNLRFTEKLKHLNLSWNPLLYISPQVQTQLKQKQVKLDINLDDFDPKIGFKKWITEKEKEEILEELRKK